MAEARRGWWMELGSQGSQRETVMGRAVLGRAVMEVMAMEGELEVEVECKESSRWRRSMYELALSGVN